MQVATMTLQQCVIMGYRQDKKSGEWIADIGYTGGRESIHLIEAAQKEMFPVGKYGTAVIEMVPKQVIQDYQDGQFISNNWRSDLLMDFKPNK